MAKRSIIPIKVLSSESKALYDALNEGNDVTAVLVASGFLDACLGSLLETQLLKSKVSEKLLNSNSGVLGTYVSRADLCYALGVIPKPMYKDLVKIAEIRNEFAHSHMELRFHTERISKLCSELTYVSTLKNGNSEEPLIDEKLVSGPRNKFMIATVMINNKLLLRGLELERERKSA
ncbi:MAG: hypothetical protein RLZZ385_2431 [Pseudomonadota bacterium]|jgi:DNA-binding MltR family transcriptional regulator